MDYDIPLPGGRGISLSMAEAGESPLREPVTESQEGQRSAYRLRLKGKRAPVDHQCNRLRRLLTDHPEFIEKFDTWMVNRNDEIKKVWENGKRRPAADRAQGVMQRVEGSSQGRERWTERLDTWREDAPDSH